MKPLLTRLPAALLVTAAALPWAPPARAQERESEEQIVVTAQRENQTQVVRGGDVGVLGDQAAEDVPFNIRSYGETLILNQQPQTLGQVLENDPSIRTTYGFGNAAEQFVIRGFTLFGDDIGLDGLYGITPRQLVAPELYDQVQVLSGATAFLNGAAPGGSGIGGSVNLIPKRAGDDPLARFTANYASDAHVGGSFDVARRFGGGAFGLRVNGAARSGDVAIDDEFREAYVLGGALDWRGDRTRLSLDLGYQQVRVEQLRPKVRIGTDAIPAVPEADANYAQPWTYTELRDVFGMVRAEVDVADDVLLYGAFGARDGSEEGIYGGITVTDAATGAARGSALFVPRTDNNEAASAGLRARVTTGPVTHQLNAGGSMVWQVNRNAFDFLGGFGGYATNLYATPDVPLPDTGFVGGDLDEPYPISRTRLGSLFLSDTVGFFGDRVLLTAGARLQAIRVTGFSYTDGAETSRYDESAVTPVFGLVVKPADGLSLYANRIEGLAQGPTAPVDPRVVNGGEIFPPFVSIQYEVGAKLTRARFNASVALYQISQPSAFSTPVDPLNPSGPLVFGLNGEQRNRGLEVSVDGEPAPGLRIIAGASFNEAELRDTPAGANDGNRAVGVPGILLNAGVEWDLPFLRGATLTGRFVHTGDQAVNAANTLEIPAWSRLDLGARYVLAVGDRPVTLRLSADNVTNARYWASAFDVFGASLLQGTPRTVKLSASFEL